MGRFGRTYFNDPDDLSAWSSTGAQMILQLEVLDFARRYYRRMNDQTSLRKEEEIKKILRKISVLETEAIRAFVSEDLIRKLWNAKEK